jgi:hypothetical protein
MTPEPQDKGTMLDDYLESLLDDSLPDNGRVYVTLTDADVRAIVRELRAKAESVQQRDTLTAQVETWRNTAEYREAECQQLRDSARATSFSSLGLTVRLQAEAHAAQAQVDTLTAYLRAYGQARREQLALRADARGCREADEDTAPCWMYPEGEQCERCSKRPEWNAARDRERIALKAVQKAALAAVLPPVSEKETE